MQAYQNLFGGSRGVVDLGRYAGMGDTSAPTIVPTTGVTAGTPTGGVPKPSTVPLPGVPGVSFTPGQPQFFGNVPGAMLPGTLPSQINPLQAYRGPLAIDQLMANPNLSPQILGGVQGLGYYTDRLGNRILSPGGGLMRFADGGEARKEDSARAELEQLLASLPAQEITEVSVSPNARSVRRTTAKSGSTDKGKAMSLDLESLITAQASGPKQERSAAEELAALMESFKERTRKAKESAKGLMRSTFNEPELNLDRLTRTGAGTLGVRRFAEGGEATDERMVPLHLRTYISSMLGGKGKEPITESNLSGAELAKLRQLIEFSKSRPVFSKKTGKALPGVVTYAHHDAYKNKYEKLGGAPGPDTDRTLYRTADLRNTLGTFSFKEMPDGSIVVTDNYDFTGDVGEKDNWFIQQANKAGVNRPVRITLAPRKR